jgi:hypothetical protein
VHGTVNSIGAAVQVLVGLREFEPMLNIFPPELFKMKFKVSKLKINK